MAQKKRLFNTKVIHMSTDCVFSGKMSTPYIETDKNKEIRRKLGYELRYKWFTNNIK